MSDYTKRNDWFPKDIHTPVRSQRQRLMALWIILGVLAVGVLVVVLLMLTKPTAGKKPPPKLQTLVSTMAVDPITTQARVEVLGRVMPAREIKLQARVSGRVVHLHPDFIPGGIVKKGEVLVRLDDTDYKLNLQQKQNNLAQAKADLRIEEGNQFVARQEWALINDQSDDLDISSEDLALRKPQLEKVQADVNVAATDLEKAKVDLERTVIRAPFNAVVRDKEIDLGSQVSSQSTIATLTGTNVFWAEISVPVDKLEWIVLPQGSTKGSAVTVYGNDHFFRQGELVNLKPEIDTDGLMARLLVAVKDPLGLRNNKSPLLLGSFVRVAIDGKSLNNVFEIPRAALKDTDTVLTVSSNSTLHMKPVSVIWRTADAVYIDKGLQAGDRIIVSNVAAPIEGMELLLASNEDKGKPTGKDKVDERQ